MIYVVEKDFDRQLELLVFLASIEKYIFCGWLYPESKISACSGYSVTSNPENLIPVTSYGDNHKPKCTEVTLASKSSITSFCANKFTVIKNFDSLALYKTNTKSWSATTIGHEGICLIQDDSLLLEITGAGFIASLQAPEWW